MLAAALLLVALTQGGEEEFPVLRVDETVEGEIRDGDPEVHTRTLDTFYAVFPVVGQAFRMEVEEAGPYHIELHSFLFDCYLVLRDDEGAVLAEDDDGLIGPDSRIAVELAPGTVYSVEACALHGGRGPFELSLAPGTPAKLDATARARAERAYAQQQLAAVEERYGAEHAQTAVTLRLQARMLHDRGDFATAQPLYERALTIREKTLGPEHPDTAVSVNDLAMLLQARGEYSAARPLYERGLAIREKVLGPEHPDTAWGLYALATLLHTQGAYAAARPLYDRALAIREKVLGPEHPDTATSLTALATLLHTQGDYAAAQPLYERAFGIREKVGPEHPDTATNLNNLALLLHARGDYAAARPLFERALAIREKVLGPEHLDTATSLNNLALLLHARGDYAAAQPPFERALAVREKVLGPEHPDTAASLNNLAKLRKVQGDYAAARPLYDRALAIREKALGQEHPDTATSLNNLAGLLLVQGDYAAARRFYERALAIDERVLGPEHPDIALFLAGLAAVLQAQGNYDAARMLHERALAIHEKTAGPEHPDTIQSLNNLAAMLKDQGDYVTARPLYERALAIAEGALGPEHFKTAISLHNLAGLLAAQGDHAAARPLYERALAINERVLGPEHPNTAASLHSLAVVVGDQGDDAAAQRLYERALATYERILGPEHPHTAMTLNNLAALLQDQGDYDAARLLHERALRIREDVLGPEHPETAMSLVNLATLLWVQGDYAAARPLYERALAIDEKTLGPDHPDTAKILGNLAFLLLDVGEAAEASELLRSGSSGRRQFRRRLLSSLSEGERFAVLAQDTRQLEVELIVAERLDSPSDHVLAYESLLDWKGQVARLGFSSRVRIAAGMTLEQRAQVAELQVLQRRLSALAFETDVRDRQAHAERMGAAREERNRLEVALTRSLAGDGALPSSVSFAELRGALPEDAAFLDLLVHSSYQAARWEDGHLLEQGGFTGRRISAWITRAGLEQPTRVDLGPAAVLEEEVGPAAVLEEEVGAFLADLVALRGVGVSVSERPSRLRELLWDPLAPHLEGVDTIFVSPDGFLGTLPLETIPLSDGTVLLEHHSFVYLQDASWLVRRGDAPDAELDSLLTVGGVDFRSRAEMAEADASDLVAVASPVRGGFSDYWGRLPATGYEAQVVFDLHEDEFGESGERLLLQTDAPTEERLKRELPRQRVLHLATHGFFNPDGIPSIWDAAREAAQEDRMRIETEEDHLVGMLPGLLSGLVCAGANRPDEAREDGYLTAEEVSWLDLSSAELVVLSACDTGLGRAQSGEGLIGLRSAFRNAGAKTVISSLWSVQDESTAELMRDFYKNLWIEKMPRGEALRQAQLAMLNRNRIEHGEPLPATWGAFVLSGEWR